MATQRGIAVSSLAPAKGPGPGGMIPAGDTLCLGVQDGCGRHLRVAAGASGRPELRGAWDGSRAPARPGPSVAFGTTSAGLHTTHDASIRGPFPGPRCPQSWRRRASRPRPSTASPGGAPAASVASQWGADASGRAVPLVFEDAVLYTFVSESHRDTDLVLVARRITARIAVRVRAQRSAAVLVRRSGGAVLARRSGDAWNE